MNSFYMEESELLAFAIYAVVNYREDEIKSFNEGDHGLRIYHHEENKNISISKDDAYLIRIARLDEDGLKEENLFYIYQSDKTAWNFEVWKVTDMYEHPEWKGQELLKIVPHVLEYKRAKITAVLELQDWTYS